MICKRLTVSLVINPFFLYYQLFCLENVRKSTKQENGQVQNLSVLAPNQNKMPHESDSQAVQPGSCFTEPAASFVSHSPDGISLYARFALNFILSYFQVIFLPTSSHLHMLV